jgi:hypothetical protein
LLNEQLNMRRSFGIRPANSFNFRIMFDTGSADHLRCPPVFYGMRTGCRSSRKIWLVCLVEHSPPSRNCESLELHRTRYIQVHFILLSHKNTYKRRHYRAPKQQGTRMHREGLEINWKYLKFSKQDDASNEYHIPNQGKMSTATRIWKYYFVNYSWKNAVHAWWRSGTCYPGCAGWSQ